MEADAVTRYVEAVGDESGVFDSANKDAVVPPMAVAALTLGGVVNDLAIPGGTLHTSQELEFKGAVQVGETLKCIATVVQNSVRAGRRFLVVRLEVGDSGGRQVMSGRSTITLPV